MLPAGTVIEGFRVERTLRTDLRGIVYEATQLSLGRTVALRVLARELSEEEGFAERFRRQAWPDHPHLVPIYAVGEGEPGLYVATQLIRGTTLAQRMTREPLQRTAARELLADVSDALQAIHARGLAHGGVRAECVLLDGRGRAWLADAGLAPQAPTPDEDRDALAQMTRECLEGAVRDRRATPWRIPAAVVILGITVLASVTFLSSGGDHRASDTQSLGSLLAGDGARSVGCDGRPPAGRSPACTVLQTRLPGQRLVAPRDGLIKGWTIRGARGELALQVIRPRGKSFLQVSRSLSERVPNEGTHSFPANLEIRRGDRVGLEAAPGSAIGIRANPGASTARWFERLILAPRLRRVDRDGFDHEVLLRADYVPGARRRGPRRLTGRAAATAHPGAQLEAARVRVGPRRFACLTLVRLKNRIAIDYDLCRNRERQRAGRLEVPVANPRGRLVEFGLRPPVIRQTIPELWSPRLPMLELRWINPDGRTIILHYALRRGAPRPLN